MTDFTYKNYYAQIEFDYQNKILQGYVVGIKNVVTFQGHDGDEIYINFKKAVDGYLKVCKEVGKKPDKPSSGKVLVRMDPSLHNKVIVESKKAGVSANSWIVDAISKKAILSM